ncbi:MAG: alpha/beta hydrolase [Methylotenera sp.]|nr:alpha/beta hydrolase [Oligoflexia bacterium]
MKLIPRPPGARKKSLKARQVAGGTGGSGSDPSGKTKSSVTHGYFKTFDGTKLFYSIEGKGKPLIFCYGLVCSSLHWTYQIDHFKENYQTIWFDYRGHQNSEAPVDLDSLTLENLAKDIACLMDELKLKDAVFLGHSMGVNVVLELYRQHPERVAGMILANGTSTRPLDTLFHVNALQAGFDLLRRANDRSPKLVSFLWNLQKNNPLARTMVALAGFNPHLTPAEDIQTYVNQVADMDPAILIHLIKSYENYDATHWLHMINVPTLIIAGENDNVIPLRQQELMHQLIPNSQLSVIKHGSHCPQMDLPELVNHKIQNHLNEMGYAAALRPPETHAKLKPVPAAGSKAPGRSKSVREREVSPKK